MFGISAPTALMMIALMLFIIAYVLCKCERYSLAWKCMVLAAVLAMAAVAIDAGRTDKP